MKGQNWQGKEEQEREAKKKKEEQDIKKKEKDSDSSPQPNQGSKVQSNANNQTSSQANTKSSQDQEDDATKSQGKTGGEHPTDQKVNREQDKGAEHGESTDNMTPPQKRFMDELIAEANAVNSFKNATGEPKEVTDPDGLSQVGYEIQVDDQFTPDVSNLFKLPA